MSQGPFRAEEIAAAYAAMHSRVREYVTTGNWDGFAVCGDGLIQLT